jgi:hypothetical protein
MKDMMGGKPDLTISIYSKKKKPGMMDEEYEEDDEMDMGDDSYGELSAKEQYMQKIKNKYKNNMND